MNTLRWLAAALVLGLSGAAVAADSLIPAVQNPLGIWLMLFGVTFLVVEAAVPNYGVIGLGGIVMFVVGAVIVSHADVPGPLLLGLGVASAVLLACLLVRALKTRPRHAVSGDAGLIGSVTRVTGLQADSRHHGWVHLQGERWQVHSPVPLQPGQNVRVQARHGLTLEVAAADAASPGE